MKSTPELAKVREKMMPGVITRDGFLGDDKRSVAEIIQDDEAVMASLGIDWEHIAARLRSLIEFGKKGLGSPVQVEEEWSVCVDESRGKLPCPFADGLYMKHVVTIVHKPTARTLLLSELSLHMLEAHHFLEGKGSIFRMEPAALALVAGSKNP
jgi:hypothetical protein